MKRFDNLYSVVSSIENIEAAYFIAQEGKSKQKGVIKFNQDVAGNLHLIKHQIETKTYSTSPYNTFSIRDPKVRVISSLPFYYRVVHHAVMLPTEKIFVSTFTADTYSSIKGRGTHHAARKLHRALKDVPGTQYCLKLDIRQFYPSVNNGILKQMLRRKFKDNDLLWLFDEIIDSAAGLPIGNYPSQYLANFYLSYFDHWLKEVKGVKYYFRYCDDMVILSHDKTFLHQLLADIRTYLGVNLRLEIKSNYQVFPVAARGIDFVGYVFFHSHTLIRKSTKQNYCRMMLRNWNSQSEAGFKGWLKHCNSINLQRKIAERRVAA
jgi:RNA-directed DNA polymerase